MKDWKKRSAVAAIALFCGFSGLTCTQTGGTLGSSVDTGGTITVDVSASPFSFDGVASAMITIVRIDALPAGATQCESECDDGLFCNGLEICVDGECRVGIAPCGSNQACDEETNACLNLCTSDANCDDGVYCNGAEICRGGLCAAGPGPCPGQFCDESSDTCSDTCSSDAQCDDGIFCNGAEKCVGGACTASAPPCAVGQVCDETAQQCTSGDDLADVNAGDASGGISAGPYVVLFEGEKLLDLVNGQSSAAELLTHSGVPAGEYTMLRFFITRGDLSLTDGRTFQMLLPDGAQTGIKIRVAFTVADRVTSSLSLHVDSDSAFRHTPAGDVASLDDIAGFTFAPASALQLTSQSDTNTNP